MSDEAEEIRKAGKAREILTNECFKEAFQAIETAILFGLRRSAIVDEKMREKLCMRYDILHTLREQIESFIETGMLAEETLRRKEMSEAAEVARKFYQ